MGAHETYGVSAGKMQLEIQKEIIADIFPLERAVKTAEAKIFIPQHKKLNEKIINPFFAISFSGMSDNKLALANKYFSAPARRQNGGKNGEERRCTEQRL